MNRIIVLLLSCLLPGVWAPAALAWELRSEVEIDSSTLRVRDVLGWRPGEARLAGGDTVLRSGLQPGQSVSIGIDELRRLTGVAALRIEAAAGSAAVRIRRTGHLIESRRLQAAARDALAAALAPRAEHYQLQLLRAPEAVHAAGPRARIEARVVESRLGDARQVVWLSIDSGSPSAAVHPVWFAVTSYARVPVMAAAVAARDPVSVRQVSRELRRIEGTWPVAEDIFAGAQRWRARIPLAEGRVLTADLLELVPDVEAGGLVQVHAARGTAAVSVTARSRQTAEAGQSIRVVNPRSGLSFRAQVIGEAQAVAAFGGRQ